MTPESFDAMVNSGLVPANYVKHAKEARKTQEDQIRHLFAQVFFFFIRKFNSYSISFQRKLPLEGWSESDIEALLDDLSKMDSNRFPSNCGVGERESRIFSG